MRITSIEETIRRVRQWDLERGEPPIEGGFTPRQEAEVLRT
jgi:hypothetical protein